GTGNNGGDGFVIARVLKDEGYDVDAWLIPPEKKVKGDARKHFEIFEAAGYAAKSYVRHEKDFKACLLRCAVIVDALLVTGVRGEARPPYKEVITEVNASDAFVVSVDVPSGVPADGGNVDGAAVRADLTITLQCQKTGAFLFPGAGYYGAVETVGIGIPRKVIREMAARREMWTEAKFKGTFPKRGAASHKGSHGKGLLVAGSREMPGAAVMAGKSALRGGSGLLTVAVTDENRAIVASLLPEATYRVWDSVDGAFSGDFPFDLAYDAVAVGPGIGRGEGALALTEKLLRECEAPLVVDADGLYSLSTLKSVLKSRTGQTVLIPHPGEMARLAGLSVEEVQSRRFQVSRDFAREFGVWLVLKGPYTIVSAPDGAQYVNPTGNAALAKGGTGDVLTGLILAFIMQHSQLQPAVSNAVYAHGKAADGLVENRHSKIDVLATDLIEAFPQTLHRLLSDD
ncbi:MAG TPA: NAD(P)H-hydrate dehydratase, partial [Bacillales bacterium]|nr:NAD(P)H-hydrate dehydratase [Bacillales bacterium]